jgi:hypothetical protein
MRWVAFRIWAIEHFGTWPNRLHALTVALFGIVAVGQLAAGRSGAWLDMVIEAVLVASLTLRVRHWDRRRLSSLLP